MAAGHVANQASPPARQTARSRDDVECFIGAGTRNGGGRDYGRLEFAALMRKMDKIDTGYRE